MVLFISFNTVPLGNLDNFLTDRGFICNIHKKKLKLTEKVEMVRGFIERPYLIEEGNSITIKQVVSTSVF